MAYTEQSNPTTTHTEQDYPSPIMCDDIILYCNSTRFYCDGHMAYTEQSNPTTTHTEQSDPST